MVFITAINKRKLRQLHSPLKRRAAWWYQVMTLKQVLNRDSHLGGELLSITGTATSEQDYSLLQRKLPSIKRWQLQSSAQHHRTTPNSRRRPNWNGSVVKSKISFPRVKSSNLFQGVGAILFPSLTCLPFISGKVGTPLCPGEQEDMNYLEAFQILKKRLLVPLPLEA